MIVTDKSDEKKEGVWKKEKKCYRLETMIFVD